MITIPALITILSILAFFVILFTVRIRVNLELKDELSLSVIAFGIKINILPAKPKKYKIKNYTPKKIAKRDAKVAQKAAKKAEKQRLKAAEKKKKKEEQKKLTKAEKKAIKAKKKASMPPLFDMIGLFANIAKLFFSGLFSKLHFHVARIRITVGSSDAATTAMMYCGICTAMKPVLMFLDKYSNLHGMKNADVFITTDYLSEELKLDLKLGFSMSLGGLLGVVLKVAVKFLVGWISIKPEAPSENKSSGNGHKGPQAVSAKESKSNQEASPLPSGR